MDVNRYNKLNGSFLNNNFSTEKIAAYIPTPTDNDYKNAYIYRYFAQKSNDINSYIYEIESESVGSIELKFYTIVKVKWRLIGSVEQIKQSNFNSIKLHLKKMPLLYLYLPNLLQFSNPN